MKHIFRKLAALLAVLVILITAASVTVGATGEEPIDPHWDGTTARWKAPALDVKNYTIVLFANYNTQVVTVTTSNDFYDFSSVIEGYTAENFAFNICANYDSISSDYVGSSDVYTKTSSTHEHPLHWVEYKAPTCTEKGVEEHFECPVCNRYFWNSKGTDEIYNPSDTVIAATGHKWGEWQTTKAATSTAEGEAQRVCKNDPSHVETKSIPKLPAETTAATQPTTAQPTTAPATTTPETTVPLVTSGTLPTTQPTTPQTTEPAAKETKILGMSLGTFIMLAVIAGLLLVVLPAVLIPVLISLRKKKEKEAPKTDKKPQQPNDPSDFNDGFNG